MRHFSALIVVVMLFMIGALIWHRHSQPALSRKEAIRTYPAMRIRDGGMYVICEEMDKEMRPIATWRIDKAEFAKAWIAAGDFSARGDASPIR